MSQSSKSGNDTNIFSELSSITVQNETTSASGMDRTPKRGAADQANDKAKKIKVEQNADQGKELNLTRKFDNQLSFVSASQVAARQARATVHVPEISDEELLAMAIEFEKKHPEYN